MNRNPSILAVGGKPVKEFRLAQFGRMRLDHALSGGDFDFTRLIAAQAMNWFAKVGRELAIDYQHQSLGFAKRDDGLSPAAGWVRGLEVRDDGLWATNVEWTDKAASLLSSGEYRYYSPVFFWADDSYTNLTGMGPVALTNDPAVCGVPPLVASRIVASQLNPVTARIAPMVGLAAEASIDQIVNALTDDNRARVAATLGLKPDASDGEIRMTLEDKKGAAGGAAGGGGGPSGGGGGASPPGGGGPVIGSSAKDLAAKLGITTGVENEEQLVSVLSQRLKAADVNTTNKGVDAAEYAKALTRIAELEKKDGEREFATICESGAGKGRITPALREPAQVLFRTDRAAFDKFVAGLPVVANAESIFANDPSKPGGAAGGQPADRVATIATSRRAFADEKVKGKTVVCSEKAWVNEDLRQRKLEPLSADEIKKDNIATEAA